MARTVDQMIEDIIRREGGYVNHPADRGGPTNFGITQRTLSRHLGRAVSAGEVQRLSREMAEEIYRTQFFVAPRIDTLPARIQPFVFDSAANHGPKRAITFVQRVCNAQGLRPLAVDGICGPHTRRAAHEADRIMGERFLADLVEERRSFYRLIVQNDPTQEVFLNGWMNRVAEFDAPGMQVA